MTSRLASFGKTVRASLATAACVLMLAGSAGAQAPATPDPATPDPAAQAPAGPAAAPTAPTPAPIDPNPGALTATANMDFLVNSPYIFRGIVQESDPQLTMWPAGDIGIALYSGQGALKSAAVNFGVWNSLQTGSSGLDGANKKLHYEEDFYVTTGLTFSKAAFATTYTAYTSPNGGFGTVHELAFKTSITHKVAPYFLLAQELGSVGADGGANKGTYVELGVGPSWPLAGGKATIAVPVKLGLSAHNYYELNGEDNAFGFFDVGGLLTVPLSVIPPSYGAWNVHVGADLFTFGDTTKTFNNGKTNKGVFLFGFGVTY